MRDTYKEALGRSAAYGLLAAAFLYPQPGSAGALKEEAAQAARAAAALGWRARAQALKNAAAALASQDDQELLADYIRVFGHSVSSDCPQYEGEYAGGGIFQKAQSLADLGSFYRAFGVLPNPDLRERPDHVSVEVGFMCLLTLKEAYACHDGHGADKVQLCRRAQERFLGQHLAPWALTFARSVAAKGGPGSIYGALAALLESHIRAELAMLKPDVWGESRAAGGPALAGAPTPQAGAGEDLVTGVCDAGL